MLATPYNLSVPTYHILQYTDGPWVTHNLCDLEEQSWPCGGRKIRKDLEIFTQFLQLWTQNKVDIGLRNVKQKHPQRAFNIQVKAHAEQ